MSILVDKALLAPSAWPSYRWSEQDFSGEILGSDFPKSSIAASAGHLGRQIIFFYFEMQPTRLQEVS